TRGQAGGTADGPQRGRAPAKGAPHQAGPAKGRGGDATGPRGGDESAAPRPAKGGGQKGKRPTAGGRPSSTKNPRR
ncbi:MAG: hypothetical protein CVU56_17935, partial [Deltaproteobacteria bacterium HGW-Deltaproteobacteria-14]